MISSSKTSHPAVSVFQIKTDLIDSFRKAGLESATLDARFIIMSVAGLTQGDVIARPDQILPEGVVAKIQHFKNRRLSGEPLDSVLGYSEFYGRRFTISKHVLSPRPETEHIIDTALDHLKSVKAPHILDLGVGSGVILITLLAEIKTASGVGVDISSEALKIANDNAETYDVHNRTDWFKGVWFEPVTGLFDLIVSNPPYITDAAMEKLSLEVSEYDPDVALRGGLDGLDAYRAIMASAPNHLKTGGHLIFEIGYDQGRTVRELMEKAGFADVNVKKDLAGHDRVVCGFWC